MPMKTDKREYRRIELMEVRAADDGQKIVEGYATTFNQPYELWRDPDTNMIVREQVDRNAFAETDMRDVILQYDHEGRVFARVKNHTLTLTPDDHGLHIRADLGGTEIGRQLYEEIDGGYTDKMSFGFTVAADRRERFKNADGNNILLRTITSIGKLFDVSAVSLPANDATEISARGISDGLIAEAMKEIQAENERERKIGEIRKMLKGDTENHDA